jgi:hypothetical protein
MEHRVGSAWSVVVIGFVLSAPASARAGQSQGTRPAPNPPDGQVQVGATQGGPTNELQPTPKFNMDYFHGEWNFETNVSESPLGEGGPMTGTETIMDVYDGRFWLLSIKGDGPEGRYTGNGVMIYNDGFAGQAFTRYEFTRGLSLIKTGTLGCDLGGNCDMYWETPPFEHNGSVVRLRGRYYLTSPASYRVTTEISVDKGEYRNFGTVSYTKNLKADVKAIK